MVQVAQLIGSHREYRFYFSTEGDFKWYKKSVESNKENIKKNKCEIVFKDAGDQVKIDENKVKSYSSSLSKFKDQYFDFGLVDGHFRMECINNSLSKIRPNGILIIDNSDAIDGVEVFFKKNKYKKFFKWYLGNYNFIYLINNYGYFDFNFI